VTATKYVYLILHFPTTDPRGGARNQEIDFIVGKDFLITARYEVVGPIHNLHKIFESEELLGLPSKDAHTEDLLERILRQLYGAITEQAEEVVRALDRIEEEIFGDNERQAVFDISRIGRILLRFDSTLKRHKEPLHVFLTELTKPVFFGHRFEQHVPHIEAEREHAAAIVSSYREVATELRETNESLLNTTQNDIISRLTIITFAALPLSFIAGLFGMNTTYTPIVESPHGFWIIVALMAAALVCLISFFKYKKWL
jgi:Mg2+ and Co2+ transporter CorA